MGYLGHSETLLSLTAVNLWRKEVMVGSISVALSVHFLTYSPLPSFFSETEAQENLARHSSLNIHGEHGQGQGKGWTVIDMENASSFMAPAIPCVRSMGHRQPLLINQLLGSPSQLQRAS